MKNPDYYKQIAQLHIQNIDQGFLSTLGVAFVSLMYRAIDEGNDSVLFAAEEGGRVVGFVAGAAAMGTIYHRMMKRWPMLCVALLPALLSPRKLRRILEIMHYSKSKGGVSPDVPEVELLSIAVDPSYRGKGYSSHLYGELVNYFARRGIPGFKIIVGEKLGAAHKFYQRMGALAVMDIEVHGGEKSTVYVQHLDV